METRQLTREIEADTVARDFLAVRTAGKTLEDVRLHFWRDRRAAVADRKKYRTILLPSGDVNAATGAIVLPRVFEQVLQNQRSVTPFARNKERRGQVGLNVDLERIGQCLQVVQPFFDELTQVDRIELDLEMAGIHSRKQKQIIDHAGKTIGLVMKGRELVVHFRRETVPQQKFFSAGAQNCDGSFQLMRRVRGKTRRALQLFVLRSERGLDAFSARPVFLGIDGQLRDRRGKAFRDEMTRHESDQ